MGVDINNDGCGEPVLNHKKPNVGKTVPKFELQTSDEFDAPKLGLQWQWHAVPNPAWYSLSAQKGYIRLYAWPSPTELGNLYFTSNLLLQKLTAPAFSSVTKLSMNSSLPNERAGLTIMGNKYSFICLQKTKTAYRISLYEGEYQNKGYIPKEIYGTDTDKNTAWLKVQVFNNGTCSYSYSLDGNTFNPIDHVSELSKGVWIGAKIGIFCLNPNIMEGNGYADFDYFRISGN